MTRLHFEYLKQQKLFDTAAYHAQRAAEKYVKAALIESRIIPQKNHDIRMLMMEHPNHVADQILDEAAGRLNSFAIIYRYPAPGNTTDPTLQLIHQAESDLALIKAWALSQIP